jgi:hypothetical protein
MRTLFSGEYRRAAIMGAVGAPIILALLVFRLLSGGDPGTPVLAGRVAAPVAAAGATPPTVPVPAPSLAVDPALLRDPFCPLVTAPAAAGSEPVACRRGGEVPPGLQAVGLEDIFVEGGVRLARMQVGQFTYPNLHEGDAVAGAFRVVSLAERCGEFEAAGKAFSLCLGERAFK